MENNVKQEALPNKNALEKWALENFGPDVALPDYFMLVILYKLNLLEEKINNIEHQTKTHWATQHE
jgi:hypothetical protein